MISNISLPNLDTSLTAEAVALKTAFGIISTFASGGNGLLMWVIIRSNMLKSSYNVLILNLALADFITG